MAPSASGAGTGSSPGQAFTAIDTTWLRLISRLSGAALRFAQGAQRVGHGVVAAPVADARVADLDAGDAGAVGLGARAADGVLAEAGDRGEVRADGVLDEAGLLAVAGEHDALLVEELGGVVRPHRQGDVGHRALDLVELLVESLWRHGVFLPLRRRSSIRAAGPLLDTAPNL